MHWLAIHFPQLPLEALIADDEQPRVVATRRRQRRLIHCCNATAAASGIHPGQPLAAARALCAGLHVVARAPRRERQALEQLAAWAWQYSDQVSLEAPDLLLFEIARSQKLFGGLRALIDTIRAGLAALGHVHRYCAAPTPAAAALLARAGYQCNFRDSAAVRRALRHVPLSHLPLDAPQLRLLHDSGLRHVAELLCLPSDELARRLGADFPAWLARLDGRQPDPRPRYRPPPRFARRLTLPADATTTRELRFAVQRLIRLLCGYLRGIQHGATRLDWRLIHDNGGHCDFQLHPATPQRDPEALLELMWERLERLEPAAPVRELGLRVTRMEPLDGHPGDLFDERPARTDLPARLRARLGDDAVRGLSLVAEHRPEYASRELPPGDIATIVPPRLAPRPAWLLPEAQRLEERDGRPWLHGPLDLENEAERIESGWWDAHPVRRDYFIARDRAQRWLWIYHDLRHGGWYLHGVFD